MPRSNKVTTDLEVIKKAIESESMLDYIEEHNNSEYVFMYKYLTHSDLISSGKRNESQSLDHNLLNYLSVSTMEDMENKGAHFETAHQTCISLPKIFTQKIGFADRSETGRTIQYNINDYANIFLVNDTLDYFQPTYTKQIFEKLGKNTRWNFDDYTLSLDTGDFTNIGLTWAAHGIGTSKDIEFHKLRRNLFRTDTFAILIEINGSTKNIFIMTFKNPRFFTILGIKNDTWLRLTEIKLDRLAHQIGNTNNLLNRSEDAKQQENTNKTRAKQSARRKELAKEMMNYTVHENEVICPLTGITINFNDVGTLFRASHIKAYKDCNENEKYDINNGILMCANADALFDKHLFTISENGEFIFSELIKPDRVLLNKLLLSSPIFKDILNSERLHYLEEHRRIFWEKERMRLSGNSDIGDSEEVTIDYLDE